MQLGYIVSLALLNVRIVGDSLYFILFSIAFSYIKEIFLFPPKFLGRYTNTFVPK